MSESIETDLLGSRLLARMTVPEARGLGLLVGELRSERSVWDIRGSGLISSQFDGVTLVLDVAGTVRSMLDHGDNHIHFYVTPEWWGRPSKREMVCLHPLSPATATDACLTVVMLGNCGWPVMVDKLEEAIGMVRRELSEMREKQAKRQAKRAKTRREVISRLGYRQEHEHKHPSLGRHYDRASKRAEAGDWREALQALGEVTRLLNRLEWEDTVHWALESSMINYRRG